MLEQAENYESENEFEDEEEVEYGDDTLEAAEILASLGINEEPIEEAEEEEEEYSSEDEEEEESSSEGCDDEDDFVYVERGGRHRNAEPNSEGCDDENDG